MSKVKLLLNMALIIFLFWPQNSSQGQKVKSDSLNIDKENRELSNNIRNGILTIISNNDSISSALTYADQKVTPKTRTIVKKEIVYKKIPVVQTIVKHDTVYRDSVFVSNGIGVEKPIVVFKAAPVYPGDLHRFDSTKTTPRGPLAGWKPFKFLKRKNYAK